MPLEDTVGRVIYRVVFYGGKKSKVLKPHRQRAYTRLLMRGLESTYLSLNHLYFNGMWDAPKQEGRHELKVDFFVKKTSELIHAMNFAVSLVHKFGEKGVQCRPVCSYFPEGRATTITLAFWVNVPLSFSGIGRGISDQSEDECYRSCNYGLMHDVDGSSTYFNELLSHLVAYDHKYEVRYEETFHLTSGETLSGAIGGCDSLLCEESKSCGYRNLIIIEKEGSKKYWPRDSFGVLSRTSIAFRHLKLDSARHTKYRPEYFMVRFYACRSDKEVVLNQIDVELFLSRLEAGEYIFTWNYCNTEELSNGQISANFVFVNYWLDGKPKMKLNSGKLYAFAKSRKSEKTVRPLIQRWDAFKIIRELPEPIRAEANGSGERYTQEGKEKYSGFDMKHAAPDIIVSRTTSL